MEIDVYNDDKEKVVGANDVQASVEKAKRKREGMILCIYLVSKSIYVRFILMY